MRFIRMLALATLISATMATDLAITDNRAGSTKSLAESPAGRIKAKEDDFDVLVAPVDATSSLKEPDKVEAQSTKSQAGRAAGVSYSPAVDAAMSGRLHKWFGTTESAMKDITSHASHKASSSLGEFSDEEIKMLESVKTKADLNMDMAGASASLDKTKAEAAQDMSGVHRQIAGEIGSTGPDAGQGKLCSDVGKQAISTKEDCHIACANHPATIKNSFGWPSFNVHTWVASPKCFIIVAGQHTGHCNWNTNNAAVNVMMVEAAQLCTGGPMGFGGPPPGGGPGMPVMPGATPGGPQPPSYPPSYPPHQPILHHIPQPPSYPPSYPPHQPILHHIPHPPSYPPHQPPMGMPPMGMPPMGMPPMGGPGGSGGPPDDGAPL